jgi:hypothetical protein
VLDRHWQVLMDGCSVTHNSCQGGAVAAYSNASVSIINSNLALNRAFR